MLRYSRFFLLITLAATLFHACDKSEFYSGKGVSFNASSKSIATKVSYGETSDDGIRAIDWNDKDKILIYCPQTTEKQCDYVVDFSKVTRDEIVSIAKGVSPVGDALKWSEGEHKFYCVYPSPSVNAVTKRCDDDNNIWKGTIPAVQYYPDDGKYSDLSQYMMLVGYAECAEPQPAVNVDFYPVTTCLEFEMTNKGECDLIINSISLSSSSQPLSGNFKVTYNDSQPEGEDRFVTAVSDGSTSNSVEVNFDDGQPFDIDSHLSFKMFLNPAEDIINPTLTINAKRKDGVFVVLSTTLKKKNNVDLKILKKHITPLTGILVKGGILFTTFGEPDLAEWVDDVEDNITVSDEYEYFLEVVDNSEKTLTFDDEGDGLSQALKVKSYKKAKDEPMTPVMPSLEFSESHFFEGTNPTITLSNPAECIYDIEFKADKNSPVVTTVDVSSALKNATFESNKNLSSGGTANCYVVKAPGNYKFEIAYGNKTKYDNTYDGTKNKPAGSNVDVLWQTPANLITSVAYSSDGYITFTVAQENIQQGNALIVLKNGSTITWSWHIWFTDADVSTVPLGYYSTGTRTVTTYSKRECTVVVSNPYDPFKSSNATITMSQGEDKEETSENISSGCTYYQWGRKDPFLYSNSFSQESGTGQNLCILSDLISNPNKFYVYNYDSSEQGRDCNKVHDDYWNTSKTIFDPSPVGYKVRNISEKSDVPTNVNISNVYSLNINNNPSITASTSGTLCFWSSSTINQRNAKCSTAQTYYSSYTKNNTSKANAYCVMCVRE